MKPDLSDPTDPRAIALLFRDPTFHPEWAPEACPPWPGASPSMGFRAWAGERLPELDRLVFEEQGIAMGEALKPEHIERMRDALGSREWAVFAGKASAAAHELGTGTRKVTLHELENKLSRLDEPKRRGRTRDPASPERDAREAAAWDIWKLRKIICPRFWPSEAVGDFRLASMELPRIAAERHGCEATVAKTEYEHGRYAANE